MVKKPITYVDFNGVERTEDFYFNLSKAEVAEWELSVPGGLGEKLQKVVSKGEPSEILPFFKELILKSYGEKSDDGRRFIKSKEMADAFSQTEAYSVLFMEMATDPDSFEKFINGIIPTDK